MYVAPKSRHWSIFALIFSSLARCAAFGGSLPMKCDGSYWVRTLLMNFQALIASSYSRQPAGWIGVLIAYGFSIPLKVLSRSYPMKIACLTAIVLFGSCVKNFPIRFLKTYTCKLAKIGPLHLAVPTFFIQFPPPYRDQFQKHSKLNYVGDTPTLKL
jgi:hypothetical protein